MENKKYQIITKLFVLLGGCMIVMLSLIGFSLYQVHETMLAERKMTLQNIVESALSGVQHQYDLAQTGKISTEQAQENSKDIIRAVRFGEGGYLFVNTTEGLTIAHAIYRENEGKFQYDLQDSQGTYIVRDLIRLGREGGGYSYYYYKKPSDPSGKAHPKLTYAKLFKPWDWVLATGLYVDDIDVAFYEQVEVWIKILILPFLLLCGTTYYLGVLIARPILELEKSREKAEMATRAKSDFLANMSHEIRTPLNGAMGMMSLVLGTKLNLQQREWGQIAYQSCEELLNLINDILDISKVEAGHMILEKIEFDLQANIKMVTDLLYPRAHRKGIELIVAFQNKMPDTVVGDPVRLRQILLNLVGNAIKFTSEGYIMISVECDDAQDSSYFKFEIKDTGIGIPQDKLTYVFEKFSQAEESTTRQYGGTGLGLTICQKLSALMGGQIGVRSALGHGSTFWFTARFARGQGGAASPALSAPVGRGRRVLVAMPNDLMAQILSSQMSGYGYVCRSLQTQTRLEQAVQQSIAIDAPYDLVFVDVEIVGGESNLLASALDQLLTLSGSTDFILIAAPDRPIDIDHIALKKYVGVLTKPVFAQDVEVILDLMKKAKEKARRPSFIMAREGQMGWSEPSEKEAGKTPLTGKKILIVEDQTVNQMLMRTIIHKFGCEGDVAANGVEALRFAGEKQYDLIFMDGHMPEMDGFEATKQIREFELRLNRHTPIVALTADAMKGDREKCLAAGMDDYLQKPVKTDSIKQMIVKYAG